MKRSLVVLLVLVALAGGAYALGLGGVVGTSKTAELKFRTAQVERGEVVEGVAASGTIPAPATGSSATAAASTTTTSPCAT